MALTRDDVYALALAIATVNGHPNAGEWAEAVSEAANVQTAVQPEEHIQD